MQNFHENKLWQDSFVALMDVHEVADELADQSDEIVKDLLDAAKSVASKIADGLSRNDHRLAKDLIFSSIGLVAITRTQLAVAWARKLLDDETFKTLDDKYSALSNALQSFR